jgi:transposase-like protein
MHDIQSPRRRRHQPEIDQLVREFRDSGLNQREFAQKIGVHPLTVNRWIRTTPDDSANPSASSAGRGIDPTSPPRFVAVEVRRTHPARSSAAATPGDWPEIVAPNGWKLRVPLGAEFSWVGELLAQLPPC